MSTHPQQPHNPAFATGDRSLTVGILGGMGPAATADFYDKLVRATPAATDQDHLRVVIWADPAVPDRTAALLGTGPDPTPWLLRGAEQLRACGADLLAVPCNTAHAFAPRVAQACGLPLVSIIDVTADAVRAARPRPSRAGLLATTGTVRSGLYHSALTAAGIDVVVPDERGQRHVMDAIAAVKGGRVDESVNEALAGVAGALVDAGAQTVIAGCTEIVLGLRGDAIGVPLLDPAQLLAERVVRIAMPAVG
jgi:aspartate racemase